MPQHICQRIVISLLIHNNPVSSLPLRTMTCSASSNTDATTATTMTSQGGKYHGRGHAEGHIPRPSNSFMLYKSDLLKREVFPANITQQIKSRLAGVCWKQLPPAEVMQWKNRAKKLKEEHHLRYPDFRYNSTPKAPIKRRRRQARKEKQSQDCNAPPLNFFSDAPIQGNNTICRGKGESGSTSQRSSPVGQELAASCQYEKIFMDLLIRPPSANAEASGSSSSDWGQQREEPWNPPSSSFGKPHPVKNAFPCYTAPTPSPDDWSHPCPPETFQSVMDTLQQLTNPILPHHTFERSQYEPSTALLSRPVQGHTCSLPLVPLPYAPPMTLEKSYTGAVDQTHFQSVEFSKSVEVLPAPSAPRPVLMCHDFSYLIQHPQSHPLQLQQQQFTNDNAMAMEPPDQDPGLFGSVLDMGATDIGVGMGMQMDMRMGVGKGKGEERIDWGWDGNKIRFGDGMGGATGARTYHGPGEGQ